MFGKQFKELYIKHGTSGRPLRNKKKANEGSIECHGEEDRKHYKINLV